MDNPEEKNSAVLERMGALGRGGVVRTSKVPFRFGIAVGRAGLEDRKEKGDEKKAFVLLNDAGDSGGGGDTEGEGTEARARESISIKPLVGISCGEEIWRGFRSSMAPGWARVALKRCKIGLK